ncbi:MAG: hypothetical protein DDT38_01626 [Firmicutes bacterium]|nr:hypothetical protein [candidate division NPL-UPA2 bacterium]
MTDNLKPCVNVEIEVRDSATGALIRRETRHNLVTMTGRNLIRDLLHWTDAPDGLRRSGLNFMALGTGAVAPVAANTALQTEVFRSTITQRIRTDGQTVYRLFLGSASANGHTLTEAGLFGDTATITAGSGILYARVTFAGIVKTSAIAVTFAWTLTWGVA